MLQVQQLVLESRQEQLHNSSEGKRMEEGMYYLFQQDHLSLVKPQHTCVGVVNIIHAPTSSEMGFG